MMKRVKRALALLMALAILGGGFAAAKFFGVFCMGNYGLPAAERENTVLRGKTVLFLGSSVTYGACAFGKSFVDDLAEIYGVNAVKEAVSGTTLADLNGSSYVARLKKLDPALRADAFVCQLSTNDASKNVPLGAVAAGFAKEDFDTSTVAGAIEYIFAYAKETWGCPVAFYTQARYDSAAYAEMVTLLCAVREKWGITVIDLWNSEAVNDITPEARRRYMADAIHPTRAGYRAWWLPVIAEALQNIFA